MKRNNNVNPFIFAVVFVVCFAIGFLTYSTVHAEPMAHWANFRTAGGDMIGRLSAGTYVEPLYQAEEDVYRTYIYVPSLNAYGYVCSVYLYGGTEWQYANPYDWPYDGGSSYSYGNSDYNSYDYYEEEEEETYVNTPKKTDGGIDYGSSYGNFYYSENAWVEVDISDQTCRLWDGNDLIAESLCVTGNKYNCPTPIGEWEIYYKEANTTLRGTSPYTGDSYATPVDYWMPFCGGCGLHDATWRDEFGGDIYETGGSYGCVNLPHWMAQKMYNYVDSGSSVIVHE